MTYITPQAYWLIHVERVDQSAVNNIVEATATLVGDKMQRPLYRSAEWKILRDELIQMGIEFHGMPDWINDTDDVDIKLEKSFRISGQLPADCLEGLQSIGFKPRFELAAEITPA
jgi:hypothetical protein